MCESFRKLDLRFLQNKTETFLVSVTYLILRFAVVQKKFQQRNIDNHIKFEVSLHFGQIWPTVRRGAVAAVPRQRTFYMVVM